jgi:hypothetical protein
VTSQGVTAEKEKRMVDDLEHVGAERMLGFMLHKYRDTKPEDPEKPYFFSLHAPPLPSGAELWGPWSETELHTEMHREAIRRHAAR